MTEPAGLRIDIDRARDALWHLDSGVSRDEWVRIGMAAKSAGLDFEDFHDWSSKAANYNGLDARDAWRSFKEGGGINAGTLFHLARQAGWKDPANDNAKPEPKPATQNDPSKHWDSGAPAPAGHAYIQRKGGKPDGLRLVTWPLRGWAKFRGQSLEGWLMVPVRSADGALASIQFIGPAGEKLNEVGCSMAGTFTVGTLVQGALAYIVEGIGHAWSVNAASGCAAVVSFGAGNIERAAAAIKQAGAVPIIVPDRGKEESAWRSARRLDCAVAQLPEWMPDGEDINDLHQARGTEEVLAVLNGAILASAMSTVPLDVPLELPEKLYHPDQIDWRRDKVTQDWVFHQAKGTAENLARLLRGYGVRIRYNELSRDVEISVNGSLPTGDLARNVSLSMVEDLCRINSYPYTAAAGHLDRLAARDGYNPALEWVQSKPWDGRERIRELFGCLQLADESKVAISWTLFLKWMLGAVAILSGRTKKFEHVLVLVDPLGGFGKTRLFNSFCPPRFQADGVTLDPTNKDSVLEVVSKWLVELGEIGATFSKSDIENLKAFLSKSVDELRPAYARAANQYQRRTAFFGSVNRVQFLVDDTNNRRFWPIHITSVVYEHGIDMQQVWAEALARVDKGEVWYLTQDENRAIGEHNEEYRSKDRTEEMIMTLYEPNGASCRWMSASQVLDEIGMTNAKAADTRKAGALLRKLYTCKISRGVTVYHMPPSKDVYGSRPY